MNSFPDSNKILQKGNSIKRPASVATLRDPEYAQAFARMGLCVVATAYLFLLMFVFDRAYFANFYVLLAYTVFSLFWGWFVRNYPRRFLSRRWLVIFSDLGINTFFFFSLDERGVLFYPIFLWIMVGNGMRFGARSLIISMVTANLYFTGILLSSSYWRENLVAGIGLQFGLVILPLFYLRLIRDLHEGKARLEAEVAKSQAAAKAKTAFIANMSHELRTPMNGVLGMTRLLMETRLEEEQKRYLDLIHDSTRALLSVINDILDFSKVEARKLHLKHRPFNLVEIIEGIKALLETNAQEKGVALRSECFSREPPLFLGDATRVRQILYNLVGNAVKFTHRGEICIRYHCEPLDEHNFSVWIKIIDTGIGIHEEHLKQIFEEFEQLDLSPSRSYGGTGLGLAISRELAHLMGGDLSVSSEIHRGSVFKLELRLETAPKAVKSRADRFEAGLPQYGLRVLLAEDNPVNQLVAMKFLSMLGVKVTLVQNGRELIGRYDEQEFDLIFMDVQMPIMDGLEATRRIRAMASPKNAVPIVALTANVDAGDWERCRSAGMNAHLKKPVTPEDISACLDQLITSKHLKPGHS